MTELMLQLPSSDPSMALTWQTRLQVIDQREAVQLNGTALLAASIKSPDILSQLIACGAAAVTLPPESLIAWAGDPLTQTAMAQFEGDISASQAYTGKSDIG